MFIGCGKSGSQDQNNSANQTPSSQAPASTPAPEKGAAAAVNAIDYHKLQSFLPDIDGYQKGAPEGANLSMGGMTYSESEAKYTNGNASIKVTIFDYAGMPDMLAPYKMKFSFENDEGYTKSVDWNGYSGWETWEKKNNTANAAAIVSNRVAVVLEGEQQNDASTVHGIVNKIDLKGIAALCGNN
ncbi:MAG: hypothetical protein ACRETL_07525 [Gammaproteobacteria bacterium]